MRVGNQAYEHVQHDVYGTVVLAATQAFFDQRLRRPAGEHDLPPARADRRAGVALHDQPDAGLWEFRTHARTSTPTRAVMCWAACDRLARIAAPSRPGRPRATHWQARADQIRATILRAGLERRARQLRRVASAATSIDASLLLLHELGFIRPDDPRFAGTRRRGRARAAPRPASVPLRPADDFGAPGDRVHRLHVLVHRRADRAAAARDEARELFENMLACRNHLGLLSEDIDPETGELWGNFPQTYSLVGLINCAMKLSKTWEDVV